MTEWKASMASFLISEPLLNALMMTAEKAPVPFAETKGMWNAVFQLKSQPYEEPADAPAPREDDA
ncbi:hypothetical protein [Sphingobium sp. Z007]|uniref:hypothetical protein n=2 Tax=Sphingobium sp. Z007 TaxID=627495 RepID=UPI000B4A499B|nr:hypothetical protein [Sphingobium sp. Z007]